MLSPNRTQSNNTNKRTKKAKNTTVDENTSPNNDRKDLIRLQKQKTKMF